MAGRGSSRGPFADRLQSIVRRGPGAKALVIRTSESSPKEQSDLEEDLTVMSHILDKALDESGSRRAQTQTAMGIDLYFAPGPNSIRSLFLDGYGALFMVRVGFPLLPPPSKDAPRKEEPSADSSWEEARREVYGHPGEGRFNRGGGVQYDEDKVNKLKDEVIDSLKNACNIRSLKNDEAITVCIIGDADGAPRVRTLTRNEGGKIIEEQESMVAHGGTARGTIMTIRVKKADAEAYAKGKMDKDDFRKKAKITTYEGSTGAESGTATFGNIDAATGLMKGF